MSFKDEMRKKAERARLLATPDKIKAFPEIAERLLRDVKENLRKSLNGKDARNVGNITAAVGRTFFDGDYDPFSISDVVGIVQHLLAEDDLDSLESSTPSEGSTASKVAKHPRETEWVIERAGGKVGHLAGRSFDDPDFKEEVQEDIFYAVEELLDGKLPFKGLFDKNDIDWFVQEIFKRLSEGDSFGYQAPEGFSQLFQDSLAIDNSDQTNAPLDLSESGSPSSDNILDLDPGSTNAPPPEGWNPFNLSIDDLARESGSRKKFVDELKDLEDNGYFPNGVDVEGLAEKYYPSGKSASVPLASGAAPSVGAPSVAPKPVPAPSGSSGSAPSGGSGASPTPPPGGSGAAPSVGAPSVAPRPVPAPSGGSSQNPPPSGGGSSPPPGGSGSSPSGGSGASGYEAFFAAIAAQCNDRQTFIDALKGTASYGFNLTPADIKALADKYFPITTPPLGKVDALGYGGALDLNDLQEAPQFGEDPASNAQAEKSRIRSQSFAEWVLQKRRYASNEHIKDLAKRYGINVNAAHLADVREKMGIDFDPRRSRYADAYYRAQDFLEQSQEDRMRDRADLEGMGKIKPDAGAGSRASLLERLNPRSRFNEEKRQTEEKLSKVLEDLGNALTEEEKNKLRERVDELEKKLEAYRKGIRPEASASEKDERSVERARNSLDELAKLYDPQTGRIDPNAKLSPETLALLNSRKPEDVAAAFGNPDASSAPASGRAASSGSSGFGFVDRIRAGAARGRLRGETIGKFAGGTVAKEILGGAAQGAARGGAIGAAVGGVVGGIASGVKQLVQTCRRIYRGVKESIAATLALAPFNGQLGAGRAQFEGREFGRKVRFAEGTSEARIKLLREQDKLAEETLELRTAFSNVGIFLQTIFLKALRGVVAVLNSVKKVGKAIAKFEKNTIGKAKKSAKAAAKKTDNWLEKHIPGYKSFKKGLRKTVDTVKDAPAAAKELWRSRKNRKEQKEFQARQKDQNQIVNEGNVARKFFETGEIDAEALAKTSWANMDKEAVKKMLGDKSKRDEFEDLIAYNDLNRGYGYFQGYQGIEGGTPKSQEDLKDILKVVQSIHLATLEQKQEAAKTRKAAEETAENTRDKNQNIQQQPIFDAMKQIADRFKPTGNEKAYSGEYSGSWGAEQEKQYGRFAGESVETWGLERNAKGRSGR